MPFVIIFFLAALASVCFILADFVALLMGKKRTTSSLGRIFIDCFMLIICPALYILFSFEYNRLPSLENNETLKFITYVVLSLIVTAHFLLYRYKTLPENIHLLLLFVIIGGIIINILMMNGQEPFFIVFHILIILQFVNQLITSLKHLASEHYSN